MWKTLMGVLFLVCASRTKAGSDLGVSVDVKKVVWCCYFHGAQHRFGRGKCDIEDMDPSLCTHMVYSYVDIDKDGNVILWGEDALRYKDNMSQLKGLKKINRNLKTILAVGGQSKHSAKYSKMAYSRTLRATFVKKVTEIITLYEFDGLQLAWLYPTILSPHKADDVKDFTILLSELRQAFDEKQSGLILSAEVAPFKIDRFYNIPEISKLLDYIGLMTYDMNSVDDKKTGHNLPLHRGEGDDHVPRGDVLSADVAVEYWLSQGAPPEKILLALPFFGHSFKLKNPATNSVRQEAVSPGIAGLHTNSAGSLGFNEICLLNQIEPWNERFDEKAKVPYKTFGYHWISYDNKVSLTHKIKYALSMNLGGVTAYTIDTDDCQAACGDGKFPLLKAINEALEN